MVDKRSPLSTQHHLGIWSCGSLVGGDAGAAKLTYAGVVGEAPTSEVMTLGLSRSPPQYTKYRYVTSAAGSSMLQSSPLLVTATRTCGTGGM